MIFILGHFLDLAENTRGYRDIMILSPSQKAARNIHHETYPGGWSFPTAIGIYTLHPITLDRFEIPLYLSHYIRLYLYIYIYNTQIYGYIMLYIMYNYPFYVYMISSP